MKQKSQKINLIILLLALITCLLIAAFAILKFNTYHLELSIPNETIVLEYGIDELPEVTAICKGSILNRKGVPVETTMSGNIDTTQLGSYTITYTATYHNISINENRSVLIQDTTAPVIELIADPNYFTSPIADYVEEGFTAVDNYDGDITDKVVRVEENGIVTYTVTDSSGNSFSTERTIVYKDVIAPTISLIGDAEFKVNIGKVFSDPGYTAIDDVDGEITDSVTVDGTVDTNNIGSYTLTYKVEDSSKNQAQIKRTVIVGDFTAPTLSLSGKKNLYIKIGDTFTDPGFSAKDNVDGDITSKVKVTGKVDTTKMGRNTITYTVSDSSGNTTKVTRSVLVYKQQAVASTINPGNKVVYLTFDDGPGAYTARLLDILDKYNVKATFFVTNQFPKYQHMIGEIHRRGHTVALHTYSHVYSKIYSSEESYYKDLDLIHNICVKQTGVAPSIVRFPGGTNNAVSKSYCTGIMTQLAESISYHGYLYADWNVNSQDAGGATTAQQVAQNVIKGIQKQSISNVLQHDIKSYSVEAVDEIIFWGLENGYTFLPMTTSSPMIRFAPQN